MPSVRQSGFSLIELLVVVAIVAVLAALAFPSFQGSMRSNRVATASNEVLASLSLARTEAIKGIGAAGVCPSTDGANCTSSTNWGAGWIVWRTDITGTGPVRTVVRYVQQKSAMVVTGPAAGFDFNVQGRSVNGAGQVGVSPMSATSPARCILLNAAGQSRVVQGACS